MRTAFLTTLDVAVGVLLLVVLGLLALAGAAGHDSTPAASLDSESECIAPGGAPAVGTAVQPGMVAVTENPRLAVAPDGAASGILRICNSEKLAHKLALNVSDFSASGWDGNPFPLNATASLSATTPGDAPIADRELGPMACIGARIDVGNLWQAGPFTAILRDGPTPLAVLTAGRDEVPFKLRVDGPNPERLDLTFVRDRPTTLRIRNEDPMTYRFRWRLELGDEVQTGCKLVSPRGVADVKVRLNADQFGFFESGFLRAAERKGKLILRHEPDASFRNRPADSKDYQVTAKLSYYSEFWQVLLNVSMVLLLLMLGILASLAINYALPMQRKRVEIKQELSRQDGRLNGLGDLVGSSTLNVLRVEQRRLHAAVDGLNPAVPIAEEVLPQLQTRATALVRRIDLTVDAAALITTIRGSGSLAPFEAEEIADRCATALRIVETASPTEADLQRAQGELDSASALAATSIQNPTTQMIDALIARANAIPASVSPATGAVAVQAAWAELDSLLAQLKSGCLPPPAPTRGDYVRAAQAVWRAEALVTYAKLVKTAETTLVHDSRIARYKDVVGSLTPGPNTSPAAARLLLREVEQNVSERDVVNALIDPIPGLKWIEADPPTPSEFQIVTLRVRLAEPGTDISDARRSFVCKWLVDGEPLEGEDFTVHHYFEKKTRSETDSFKVDAEIVDGTTSLGKLEQITVTLAKPRNFFRSSTLLAFGSLGITVIVITVGLLAAAQEKLQALTWYSGVVALLLLGYGTDVIKRSLSRP